MDRGRDVAIVVVNRQSGSEIDATLDWIQDTAANTAEIVVIDDGSTDGSRERLRRRPGIHLIEKPREGLPQALNVGFAVAERRDVVTVHPGVEVSDAGWLDRMRELALAGPGAGVVGAKLVQEDGRILSVGRMPVSARGIRDAHASIGHGEFDRGQFDRPQPVDSVRGSLAYYRRDVLDAVGGADLMFTPLWWEDDDLALGARAAGFEVWTQPAVRAVVRSLPYERAGHPEFRRQSLELHARYWQSKWGWHPEFPDLHAIRARWLDTPLCWRIGRALLDEWPDTEPEVDVLVVTRNNAGALERCLASVAATRYPRVRVTVLDNGSTDRTPEFLAARAADYPFRLDVVRTPVNIGLPAGMNWLLASTRAPLVARLDDAAAPEPGWLAAMVGDLREHRWAGCVGARIDDEPDDGRQSRLLLANQARGGAILYRRKAFDRAGSYDIRYSPGRWDDTDHHIALRAAGYDVLHDGRIGGLHPLANGAARSQEAVANSAANLLKLRGKWNPDILEILDQGLDLAGREETHREGGVLVEDVRPG